MDNDLLTRALPLDQFKFTSKAGRTRRLQLLKAAKELLQSREPQDVSLADVCERAGIPRASAYHFFPNVQAVFLGLRHLQAEALVEAAIGMEQQEFAQWQQYFGALIDAGAKVMRDDPAATKLTYGNFGLSEARKLGEVLDSRLAQIALQGLAQRFQVLPWEDQERAWAVAFTLVDSVLRLSWRQYGAITDAMVEEAKRAALCYLRSYLPEYLPRAGRPQGAAG